MRVTAKDVARQVGVSRSTVSRVFTPGAVVADATRLAVESAAEALGYRPNPLAQALISRRSSIVAIAHGDLMNPFHAALAQSMTEALQQAGIVPITVMVTADPSLESLRRVIEGYQVAAVVMTSMGIEPSMVRACQAFGAPLILFNRVVARPPVSSVSSDLEQGGMLAALHVAEQGASRIAIVSGPANAPTAQAREAGFRAGLSAIGLEPQQTADGHYTYEGGAAAADTLFGAGARPDAVLCANDLSAFGVMDRMRGHHGVQVPEDCLVVGFDDVPNAAWAGYDLTSVHLPVADMLEKGVEIIQAAVRGETLTPTAQLLPCSLTVRGSSVVGGAGPPPQTKLAEVP
ncbi:MAG: LacI family DNA-binding transcriptional regulator [Devosia sp.]